MRAGGVAVGAVLVAAAWPAGVAGATDYGGGSAPDSVRHAHRQMVVMAMRTLGDGTAVVAVTMQVRARCGTGRVRRRVPLAADGTFAFNATVRDRIPADRRLRRTSRISLAGQVVGAAGSGTVSARVTFRRRGRVTKRCRTRAARAWHVRAPAAEAAGAGPRANGAYYGLTSQTVRRPRPFVLRVDPRGRRVRTAVFDYRQRCGFGPREWNNITPGGRIRPDGTFRLRERFVYPWANASERFRVRVDGRFTPTGVTGTWSVTSTARRRGGGRVIGRCRSGRQTFAATL